MDKKKFEEDKKKNRMRLHQMQKKQQDLLNPEDDLVAHHLHDNRNELMEQLKLLKKKAQLRKNEIDAKILKNLHESHTAELQQISTSNPVKSLQPKWNLLEKSSKDDQLRVKRSLFNAKPFSSYHPYSLDLKPWTAADILSLRREQFLGTNSGPPPNDYHIFKNILDQSRSYHPRKRSIENLVDNSINDINNDIADFTDKFIDVGSSKSKYDIYNSQFKKPNKVEKRKFDNAIDKETAKDNQLEKSAGNIGEKATNIKVADDSANLEDSSHIQKMFDEEETRTFEAMIKNITSFFSDLGKQIGSYIKNIAFN